jgi:hypothetical protein
MILATKIFIPALSKVSMVNHKEISLNSYSPGQDPKLGPQNYGGEVVTTQLLYIVRKL